MSITTFNQQQHIFSIITVASNGTFLLTYACPKFIELFAIAPNNVSASIENSLPEKLCQYLHQLYNLHNSAQLVTNPVNKFFSFVTEDNQTIHLNISLYINHGVPEFKCEYSDELSHLMCNYSNNSYCYCILNNNRLLFYTASFSEFLRTYNLTLKNLLSFKPVVNAMNTRLPQCSLSSLPRLTGIHDFIYLSAIPSSSKEQLMLLFVSPMGQSEELCKLSSLSQRETDILYMALDGYTNKYIASQLKISENTVKSHLYNAYKKLDVSSKIDVLKIF